MLATAEGWNDRFAKCTFDMYDGDEYLNGFKHKKCRYDKQRNLCDEIITRQQKLIEGKTYFTKPEKENIFCYMKHACTFMFNTSNRLHHLIKHCEQYH